MKLAFIGGGNMGEAMLAAVLGEKLGMPGDITVSDVREERRQYLTEKYGVSSVADNRAAAGQGDIVILAVKPQNLPDVMAGLKGSLKKNQLVISIIAGATINTLRRGFDHNSIVRVMPNTPAQVGAGVSAWTSTDEVTGEQKETARSLLGSLGKEIYFDDEKYLDMATAISGSGPAYFFLLAESLISAAVEIGLPEDAAGPMVLQTMLGSALLLEKSGKTAAELRKMVTSPGGTTAAALAEFEKGDFRKLVSKAVAAAYNRARELGEVG